MIVKHKRLSAGKSITLMILCLPGVYGMAFASDDLNEVSETSVPEVSLALPDPVPQEIELSPIQTISLVAEEKGIQPRHLVAMALHESFFGEALIGDGGCSHGWYHRNLCAGWPEDGLGDLRSETEWVADRLIANGYLEGYITISIGKYNAPAWPRGNESYAAKVKALIPMAEQMIADSNGL